MPAQQNAPAHPSAQQQSTPAATQQFASPAASTKSATTASSQPQQPNLAQASMQAQQSARAQSSTNAQSRPAAQIPAPLSNSPSSGPSSSTGQLPWFRVQEMMRFLQQRHQSQFAERDLRLALVLSAAQSKIRAMFQSVMPSEEHRSALGDIFSPYTEARAKGLTIAQLLAEFDPSADTSTAEAAKGLKSMVFVNHPDKTANLDLLQQAERQTIFMLFTDAKKELTTNGGNIRAVLRRETPPPAPQVPPFFRTAQYQRPHRNFRSRYNRYGWS
jgi:hypothetical protein